MSSTATAARGPSHRRSSWLATNVNPANSCWSGVEMCSRDAPGMLCDGGSAVNLGSIWLVSMMPVTAGTNAGWTCFL